MGSLLRKVRRTFSGMFTLDLFFRNVTLQEPIFNDSSTRSLDAGSPVQIIQAAMFWNRLRIHKPPQSRTLPKKALNPKP